MVVFIPICEDTRIKQMGTNMGCATVTFAFPTFRELEWKLGSVILSKSLLNGDLLAARQGGPNVHLPTSTDGRSGSGMIQMTIFNHVEPAPNSG